MSPRFEPDLTKARASIRVFDADDYEVVVGEPTGMLYERDDDGVVVVGVRFPLEMVGRIKPDGSLDREFEGEQVSPARMYVHTDKAWPMTKRFVMAAAGFSLEEEDLFDEEWLSQYDPSIDGDPYSEEDPELGDAWTELEGQHVQVSLGKDLYEGRETQTHGGWQPAS